MTTSNERKYPPKKQVPEKKFLLLRVPKAPTQAKPFTKTVANKETGVAEEKTVYQVNLHFQIADKRHPELCSQWHVMQATDYISGDSKLFKVLSALIGPEQTNTLIGKSCFPRVWPDGNQTPPEKLVPLETWKGLAGRFYGGDFNPPKTNDDGSLRLGDDGSPFQTVKDINTLDALGWTEEQWKLWPPPKPEDKPQAPPKQEPPAQPDKPPQTPPKEEAAPAKAPEPPKAEIKPLTLTQPTPIETIQEYIRTLLTPKGPLRVTANQYLLAKGKAKVSDLSEEDTRTLYVLLQVQDELQNGPGCQDAYLETMGHFNKPVNDLSLTEAELLLQRVLSAADVPF